MLKCYSLDRVGQMLGPVMVASALALFPLGATAASEEETEKAIEERIEAWLEEISTPGGEHKRLDLLVGNWNTEVKIWLGPDEAPTVINGTSVKEWVLGERFLRETVEDPAQGFEGVSYTGFNGLTQMFEYVWMSNETTDIHSQIGRYDPEANVLRMTSTTPDAVSGILYISTTEIEIMSPDSHALRSFETGPEGVPYKTLEITFTRQK